MSDEIKDKSPDVKADCGQASGSLWVLAHGEDFTGCHCDLCGEEVIAVPDPDGLFNDGSQARCPGCGAQGTLSADGDGGIDFAAEVDEANAESIHTESKP